MLRLGGRADFLIKRFKTEGASGDVRSSLITLRDREWIGFWGFVVLLFVEDRLSNIFLDIRPFNALVFLIAILTIGCWAGFRSALASCVAMLGYVWIIFHFLPI